VGHYALTSHSRCLAAVLACGPEAYLSHVSAAWLWGLLPTCATRIAVTTVGGGHPRGGIEVHRVRALEGCERAERDRIPTTTVARVLLDLSPGPPRRLQRAVERAERLGILDLFEVDAMLDRNRGRTGAPALRGALSIYRDPAFTRSRPELVLLDALRKGGVPRPLVNSFVAGFEIDAFWEKERFAVEVDGWEWHRSRASFERDPLRQEDLKLAGIDSIRITARRLEREPAAVASRIGRLLERRRRELGLS
jgi:hypothetical protein